MREIELKLLTDRAEAAALRRTSRLKQLTTGPAKSAQLLTVYYDTAKRSLAESGLALRLRRKGRSWTQTVKADRRLQAGFSEAVELNTPAPGGRLNIEAIPDETLRTRIEEAVGSQTLSPVFATDIGRTTWQLEAHDGSVEFALDVGEIRAGEKSAELCEFEFELTRGHPRALFEVARRLFPSGGLIFSDRNKAKRGQLLVDEGVVVVPVKPRNAVDVALRAEMTTEEAARDVMAECLEQIAANMTAVRLIEDPESAHQLRVGLRRLRSAFSVFKPILEGPHLEPLIDDARWLGQEVGRLRDLEVADVDILAPEREKYPTEAGFAELLDAVHAATETERNQLRQTVIGERAQAFLLNLAEFVMTRGWLDPTDMSQTARLARPVADHAVQSLNKVYRQSQKKAKGIDTLTIDERHELRKQLKKLRYAAEFFSPFFEAAKTQSFIKTMKKLQNILGELNDAAMTEELFGGDSALVGSSAASARAAGRLIGARLERADHAWHDARARWDALSELGPFWR